jgi:copper chaperone
MEPNRNTSVAPTDLTLVVKGMSCGHCKAAVSDHVERVAGVESVEVDLDAKRVKVRGTDIDETAVVSAVDDAGYEAVRA